MRKCNETRNYALIKSLIEEAQIMANRMEAGLSDLSDARYSYERVKELKAEIKKLKEEKKNVTGTGD
jgi:coenzyme F420-reducing hydrogenase delta subunit